MRPPIHAGGFFFRRSHSSYTVAEMITFIDESGKFTKGDGWSVVAGLTLTHSFAVSARRELASATRKWARVDGELKGRSLGEGELCSLVDILWRRQALLHVVAVNVGAEDSDGIRAHKLAQAEKMTAHLTSEHHPNLVEDVGNLRASLEAMPDQLYVQSVAMTQLIAECAQNAAMYFSTRKPEELGRFEWKIDAKSPTGETRQETWWKSVLGPIFESNAERHQFVFLDNPKADYSYFDQTYAMEKTLWRPSGVKELVSGFDIQKLMVKTAEFIDSKSEILLQAADILANRIRRCLQGDAVTDKTAMNLGRLQISQSRQGKKPQVVKFITLTQSHQAHSQAFLDRLKLMNSDARSMFPTSLSS
jgi:hypothetical protein